MKFTPDGLTEEISLNRYFLYPNIFVFVHCNNLHKATKETGNDGLWSFVYVTIDVACIYRSVRPRSEQQLVGVEKDKKSLGVDHVSNKARRKRELLLLLSPYV